MGNDQSEKNISDEYFDLIFELKMLSKTIARQSKRIEYESKNKIKEIKEYIKQREYELAKVLSYECIKNKYIIKKYQILSNRIENFAQRLRTALNKNINIKEMKNFAQQLIYAGNVMDFNKIRDITISIQQRYEDITITCTFPDDVNAYLYDDYVIDEYKICQLIEQIAEENEINLSEEFDDDEQFNEEEEKDIIEQKQIKQVEVS